MTGWNPIWRVYPWQKDKNRNTRVAPKGATPVFLNFPEFLVFLTFHSSGFWRSDRLLSVLILLLIVSNLILVYSLIVASCSYVDRLSPVAQSSMFKRRAVISFK